MCVSPLTVIMTENNFCHLCIKTSIDPCVLNLKNLNLTTQLYPLSLVSDFCLSCLTSKGFSIHVYTKVNVFIASPFSLFSFFVIVADLTSFVEDTGRNQFLKCPWQHPAMTPVSGLVSL